ncbi:MAG: hypothetical protein H0T51_19465 [Pirellulales bacterium]|nr:hypothetical protein [Pirellulales bacterium]
MKANALAVVHVTAQKVASAAVASNSDGPGGDHVEEGVTEDRRFVKKGEPVPLTPREYDVLKYVWERRKKPILADDVRAIWGKPIADNTMPLLLYQQLQPKLERFKIVFQKRGEFIDLDYPRDYWD